MGTVLKFKQAKLPRQVGEIARLRVLQGADYGTIFVITSAPVSVGRGDENDLVVSDLKASRQHAKLTQDSGGWTMRDSGSANGLLHNGKPTRSATLRSRDTVAMGETVFEFLAGEAATSLLDAPLRNMVQLRAEQRANAGSVIAGMGTAGGGASKRPLLLLAGAGLAAFLLLSDGESPPAKKKPKKAEETAFIERNLAQFLPGADSPTGKSAERFFKEGFREYRERNYLRARTQFETVLQIVPGHPLATLYLDNCKKAIEEEVAFHLEKGRKSLDSGKLKDARGHYEAVLRLLHRDQSSDNYTEARDQLKVVLKEAKGGSG